MDEKEFKRRTKAVALRVIKLVESQKMLAPLMKEADEILAMTVASIRTLDGKNPKSKTQNPKS